MTTSVKTPIWFWVVSALALIWNIFGVMAYLGQAYMTPEDMEVLPEAQRALYENQPAWVTGAFAIAVFGGTLGCIALLMRKKWASYLLIVSLLSAAAQFSHGWFMTNMVEVMGMASIFMPVFVLTVGLGLVILARVSSSKGWLS